MPGNLVSLYINDISMKLMVTHGKRIAKVAEMPLDAGLSDINNKEKEAELSGKIKNFLDSNKVHSRKIILGLSGLHCLTRPLELPILPQAMLKEAITRESQRVLPVPLEQLYISWQIVAEVQDKIHAYVVALPREMADMLVRVVNKAGYKPYLMDIKPLSLARLSRESNAILIDVQAKEFDIVFLIDKIPQPVRTVSFPSEELSLPEKFEKVKDELKRTIQYFEKNDAENPIKPDTTILVSGELAGAPELYEDLEKELGFKTTLLESPLKTVKELDASSYMVNIGLALKEMHKEAGPMLPNINVLPTPYQPKQVSTNQLLTLPAVILAIVIVVMMVMTVQETAASIEEANTQILSNNMTLAIKQAQKKKLMDEVATLQGAIAVTDALYAVYTDAYISISKTGNLMNTDLDTSVDNVVEALSLSVLNHSGSQITINGVAATEQEILDYVNNLLDSGRFDEITIASIVTEEGDAGNVAHPFTLSCYLKDGRL